MVICPGKTWAAEGGCPHTGKTWTDECVRPHTGKTTRAVVRLAGG